MQQWAGLPVVRRLLRYYLRIPCEATWIPSTTA
jgi:hypothetical protein